MGSSCCRGYNEYIITLDSKTLQLFFDSYYDNYEKQKLLSYIPISCNYAVSNKKAKYKFRYYIQTQPLFKHMELQFSFFWRYKIKVSKDYYDDLIEFSYNNRIKTGSNYVILK